MNFTVAQRVVINSKLEELRSLLTDVPQAKEGLREKLSPR